jgi:hypothetical protein
MEFEKYRLKQVIVLKPEVELPKGSQAVSVKHHDAYIIADADVEMPECWQVIYLEPWQEKDNGNQQ